MTGQTASSLAEFYTHPASPYAAFPQEHRSGGTMPVRLIRAKQDAHDFTDPAVPEVVLTLSVKADMPFRWDLGDGWTAKRRTQTGEFALVPANTVTRYECQGPHELLMLSLPASDLALLLDESRAGNLASLDPLSGATLFRDEAIRRTMMQMWAESARIGGTSDLLMDGLTQVLLARLLEKAGALRRPQPTPLLGQTDISRIDALVDEKLAERLTVEDLARVLDMPRWTFADAFKATTGETPHAYVTARRIDKACHLLRLGDMPLAEVAYATGFSSQSHMTDTFRRVLGTTPGAWRREM